MIKRIVLTVALLLTIGGTAHASVTKVDPTGPVLYIVGDSIAASTNITFPDRDGFTKRVSNLLAGAHYGEPGFGQVVNISVGGTRLVTLNGQVGWQENWAAKVLNAVPRPTTVLLTLGINDMGLSSDAVIQAAYLDVYNRTTAAGIKMIVATMSAVNNRLASYNAVQSQRYWINLWLVATFPIIARFDWATKVPSNETLDYAYDDGSGIHLNRLGLISIADAVPVKQVV